EKEKEILDLAASCGFKEGEDGLYMDDDDRIYELVCINVQKFQNLCDVFYSESFKNIKIYNSPSYRTSIRFNEDTDLLEFDFSIDGIDKDSLPQIFASLKRKKKYYRLPDGSFIPLKSEELDNVSDMIESLNIKEDSLKKKVINLPVFRAMYMDDKLNELGSVHIERSKSFSKVVSNIKEPENMEFDVPESLKPIMRGYQVTGFKWLRTLAAYRLGGILADDMGLGKTLQAISFILSVKDSVRIPSIVICPTSLIYNWESEIKKFAPSLKTLIISGNKSERENMMRRINDADVAITSYPLIRRDIISYKNIRFGYCFLDEAQYIKNPNSINAKSVKAINAQGYFALTGTPIENNLTELWSIFDFLMPGYLLSHKKFLEKFERPIMNGNKDALTDLNSHIKPFILRRLKRDVLKELPPKIESVVTAELTDAQKIIYLAYLQNIKGEIQKEIQTRGFEKSQIMILAGLTRLRQI
ncbi:MAG TPA: helicase SNF2, partial [Clostridiaceae bacterium]|nr:helicase SNF2 [Clostridiaceae bacterium]